MTFVVGDIHGCYDEFLQLIDPQLSAGHKVWSVGDMIDRGPHSPEVLRWFIEKTESGHAGFILGNHEDKFIRWLQGKNIRVSHGLQETISQLEKQPDTFKLVREYFLDRIDYRDKPSIAKVQEVIPGVLIVHAALKTSSRGWDVGTALYGVTSGEKTSEGYPVRQDWAQAYKGQEWVIHGHVPVVHARFIGRVLNIDTGCCFGGKLTGVIPETWELFSVHAKDKYVSHYTGWFEE